MSVSKNLFLAAIACLLSVSCATNASNWQPAPFQAGQQRLALGTNAFSQLTTDTGAGEVDNDVLALNATYGYFYQPNVEFGGSLGYNDTDSPAGEMTTWKLGGYLRYWLDTRAAMRPFIQGRLAIGNQDFGTGDDDLLEYGVGAGLSQFLSQSTSLDVVLEWSDEQFDNRDLQTSGLGLSAFFSVYF